MDSSQQVESVRQNVEWVRRAGLCCSCGACSSLCPADCIGWDETGTFPQPAVDADRCVDCGLCVKICPGVGVDFRSLSVSGLSRPYEDDILGPASGFYFGYAANEDLRARRTSGGLVTALAAWGLAAGRWEAVAVSRLKPAGFLASETVLATTRQQIEAAANSLYCPVPAARIFGDMRAFDGRVCFIGLPCHVHALRKAQQEIPALRERVVLAVGLFCSGTFSRCATETFLKMHGIERCDSDVVNYRNRGSISVAHADTGQTHRFARGSADGFRSAVRFGVCYGRRGGFTHPRCLVCPDQTAELADLSVGDAWGRRPVSLLGISTAIERSARAAEILRTAAQDGCIELEPATRQEVIATQRQCLATKKRLGPALRRFAAGNEAVPVFTGQPELPLRRSDRWTARLEWVQQRLARRRPTSALLKILFLVMSLLRRFNSKGLEAAPSNSDRAVASPGMSSTTEAIPASQDPPQPASTGTSDTAIYLPGSSPCSCWEAWRCSCVITSRTSRCCDDCRLAVWHRWWPSLQPS